MLQAHALHGPGAANIGMGSPKVILEADSWIKHLPSSIEAFFLLAQDDQDVDEHSRQRALDVRQKFIHAFALSERGAPPLVRFHVDKWDAPFDKVAG